MEIKKKHIVLISQSISQNYFDMIYKVLSEVTNNNMLSL